MPFDITILQDQRIVAWVQVRLTFRSLQPQGMAMCSTGNWVPVDDSKSTSNGDEATQARRAGNTIGRPDLGTARRWIWNPLKAELVFSQKELSSGKETDVAKLMQIVLKGSEAQVVGLSTPRGVCLVGNLITRGEIRWRPGLETTW